MSFSTDKFIFLDVINFVGGMSLKQFGLNYVGREITKGIFPHREFGSIEEIRNCKIFPPYNSFRSDLAPTSDTYRQEYLDFKAKLNPKDFDPFEDVTIFHTSIKEYMDSKDEFEMKLNDGQWLSFLDYLSEYCMLDVDLLCEGFSNYIHMFMDEFKISPLDSISMPSLAYRIMLKKYSNECASMFSFSSKYGFINDLLRSKSLMGGFVGKIFNSQTRKKYHLGIFQRHVITNCNPEDDKFIKQVRYAKCGKKYKKIFGFDANALYAGQIMSDLPTGPGTYFRKEGEKFIGEWMGNKCDGFSKASFGELTFSESVIESQITSFSFN